MLSVNDAAKIVHEANRIYCESIGDYSQLHWEFAPGWQQSSAIFGVIAILDNPSLTPEQSHESWLALKQKEGWKYGPRKNEVTKEHPDFMPYSHLPNCSKLKDEIFTNIIKSLIPLIER